MSHAVQWRFTALLALIALGACSSNGSTGSGAADAESAAAKVAVTVTDRGCEPNQLTVAAGQTTFEITKESCKNNLSRQGA
ncbi:MAG: cupredoxin domain-containing protein [Elainella sp.]